MSVLSSLAPERVFKYFEELSQVPRGSGNMSDIADYCVSFAEEHGLRFIRDASDNIIIFKAASKGYENAEPIILQGHLDIVCQKTPEREIDFLRDGLELYVDGDFLKARGTTLGADNGIAVAMIFAILESGNINHPEIQAVLTTDEEIGMVGAIALDASPLTAKRMINLDSEDMDCMTVSCAGGSDFSAAISGKTQKVRGKMITVCISGLCGGHSGICIHEGRINANMLSARILNFLMDKTEFSLVSVNGGDKCNAIPNSSTFEIVSDDAQSIKDAAEAYIAEIKKEVYSREPNLKIEINIADSGEYTAFGDKEKIITALLCAPNGVLDMSREIEGLVETSLNLGILKTVDEKINFGFALRSNKKTALKFLEDKLKAYFKNFGAEIKSGGHYPPWEFNANSRLQEIYIDCYKKPLGKAPRVEAIHAGLECGVFADKIENFDGIAIGPQMYDVHTTNERLSISSTAATYSLLLEILRECR